jgi:NDMA-dependent alcohol dehydrogenase
MKARAAVLFEVGRRFEVRTVEVEPPRAGEVLVRMAAGGVCHSDLHVTTGQIPARLPAILGHEGAGVVAEVGAGVTSVKPGDHVIALWRTSCGTCEYCSDGRPALCAEGTEIRATGRLGDGTSRFSLDGKEIRHFAGVSTFAEYTVVPERALLVVRAAPPLDRAALRGGAVITGVGAVVNCAKVPPGSTMAVFGTGGVGLNVVQGGALSGAEKIIAVDVLPAKLEYARRFGATHGVDASAGNPVEQVRAITGGRGVDYAFEVIGNPRTIREAYDCLAKRGTAVVVGVSPPTAEVAIPAASMVFEERTLTGSIYGSSRPRIDLLRLIDLYRAGRLKVDELLTRTWKLEEINEAYAALERGEVARSVLTF